MRGALLLAAALTSAAGAQDRHAIKIKVDVDRGRSVTHQATASGSVSMKAFDAEGKQLFEKSMEGSETVYRLTVLEADKDGRATKYLVAYDKAIEKEDGKTKAYSYQGRTVLFEKKDGKFRIGVAGDPPLDDVDLRKLAENADKPGETTTILRNLAPAGPVAVGDTWTVPLKPIADAVEVFTMDASKSSVTAKLLKVYSKGKGQFGTIEVTTQYHVTSLSFGDLKVKLDRPSVATNRMTFDLAIDGSTVERTLREEASFKAEGRLSVGEVERRVVMEIAGKETSERSAEVYIAKALTVPKVTFAPAPGEWTEFKPKDGRFLVKFPGQPKVTTSKAANYTETKWVVEIENGTVAYGVVLTEFADTDPAALQKAVLGSYAGVRGNKDIKLNGFPGVEFTHDREVNGFKVVVAERLVVTKNWSVEIMAIAIKGKSAEDKKFFDSFQLLTDTAKSDK